jgi:ubiquinone/menaquinone biosynthesis C-methylase UbiE
LAAAMRTLSYENYFLQYLVFKEDKKMAVARKLLSITLIVSGLFISQVQGEDQEAYEKRLNKLQPPGKVMDAIGVKPGMFIGEVGAGNGRYAVKMAERVGSLGKIYANDINPRKINYLNRRCKRDGITNIETIQGTVTDPKLPKEKLDMVYLINTFHHLDKPVEMMKNIIPALKPGGKLVIIEHEREKSGYMDGHSTPKKTVIKQTREAGFKLERIETFLKLDNIYIFQVKNDE